MKLKVTNSKAARTKLFQSDGVEFKLYTYHFKKYVLQWLASNATLDKEFQKNKVANIRLRAVPVNK